MIQAKLTIVELLEREHVIMVGGGSAPGIAECFAHFLVRRSAACGARKGKEKGISKLVELIART